MYLLLISIPFIIFGIIYVFIGFHNVNELKIKTMELENVKDNLQNILKSVSKNKKE